MSVSSSQPQIWTGASGSGATSGVQKAGGGHHHHHKSVSDQVNQMGSAIESALQAGTMSGDQAASLKKELADVTQILSQNTQTAGSTATTSSSGATSQSSPLSQLSDADRKKMFGELQDVRKQLHAISGTQGTSAASGMSNNSDAVSQLFSQIDSNNDGNIDKSEMTQFLANIGANALGYTSQGNASSASSVLNGSNFSIFG